MFSSRAIQASARRLAAQKPSVAFSKFAPPAAVATNTHYLQKRLAATTPDLSDSAAADSPLAKQRLNRPVSPHLMIYRPQVTWISSGLNRITGSVLSGGFYIFGFGYLVAPVFGWHWESAVIAASFGAWPVAAKIATKTLIAFPFTFHCINGLRHLMWDFGAGITNKQVIITGWTAVGLTVVSSLYLAAFV